jgi:membrane-bound serine protease (ClpP class)
MGMKTKHGLCAILIAVVLAATAGMAVSAPAVYCFPVAGSINPAMADFVKRSLDTAAKQQAACVIIELDTPGGLADAMREIVSAIFACPVPVVVYVAPSGARAASAGVLIAMAADIAAMAPGTNIGAAHPVGATGGDIGGSLQEKVTNDMAAFARSIAKRRHRNADWAEKAVRESVSITETEALHLHVIDLVAKDRDALITALDGRVVAGKGRLKLADVPRIVLHEDFRDRVLKAIADPNIAYILLMIGLAGIYFELAHPGAVLPGVIGGICLVLAFFSLQALPVRFAGVLLILLALLFFILEIKIASYGLLGVAGVVSLFLGSLMLFERGGQGMSVALTVVLPTVVVVSGFFLTVGTLVVRAQVGRAKTGIEGLIGEIGVVKIALSPEGKVFVHGELWQAVADEPLPVGCRVRVTGVRGLVLEVCREVVSGES